MEPISALAAVIAIPAAIRIAKSVFESIFEGRRKVVKIKLPSGIVVEISAEDVKNMNSKELLELADKLVDERQNERASST